MTQRTTDTRNIPDRLVPLRHMFAELLDLDVTDLPPPGSMTGPEKRKIRNAERHRALNHARQYARDLEQRRSTRVNRRLPMPEQACQCCGGTFQPTDHYRLLCSRCRKGKGPARICPYDPNDGFIR